MLTSLVFGILAGLITFATFRGVLGSIFGTLATIVATYFFYISMPTIAYGFAQLPTMILVGLIAITIIYAFTKANSDKLSALVFTGLGSGIFASFLFVVVIPLVSTPVMMGNADNYHQILSDGKVNEAGVFHEDVEHLDPTQVRLVDQSTAKKLAETKLGEDPGLGSRVDIGTMRIQNVGGKLFWIGPLEWSGFFKWAFGEAGTPGYMVVSVSNQRDVRLVKEVDGKSISIQIGEGAFFWDDLQRFVWNNGYATTPFTDMTFEVDDNWQPHWVITKYARVVGYSGNVATGAIVVNPQTREITDYNIEDAPEWIDRIQPEDFVADQIDDWGQWLHGYWSNFENRDKKKHTLSDTAWDSGLSLVWSNGKAMWYSGIQSVGSDQGTTGFMLVDSRTGKATYYQQPGITEGACQRNIYGLIAEKRNWSVSNCILYNVGGHPTYIAIIKDADGNPKEVGMASVVYRDVVVSQTHIQSALRAFNTQLRSRGNVAGTDSGIESFIAEGQVVRFGTEVLEGTSYYYLVISTEPNKVFTGIAGLNSSELPITRVGDSVMIHYDDAGRSKVDMTKFVNKELVLQKSSVEAEIEESLDDVMLNGDSDKPLGEPLK